MLRPIVLLGLALFSSAIFGQQLEFKGIPLGSPLEDFKRLAPTQSFSCIPSQDKAGETICGLSSFSFAEKQTKEYSFARFSSDGRFLSITIQLDSNDFDDVADALIAKYGKPNEDKLSTVTTRMNVRLQNRSLAWKLPDGSRVWASRYGRTISDAAVHLGLAESLDAEDRASRAKRAKGDM